MSKVFPRIPDLVWLRKKITEFKLEQFYQFRGLGGGLIFLESEKYANFEIKLA